MLGLNKGIYYKLIVYHNGTASEARIIQSGSVFIVHHNSCLSSIRPLRLCLYYTNLHVLFPFSVSRSFTTIYTHIYAKLLPMLSFFVTKSQTVIELVYK